MIVLLLLTSPPRTLRAIERSLAHSPRRRTSGAKLHEPCASTISRRASDLPCWHRKGPTLPRSDCRQRTPTHPINRVGRLPSESLAALPRIPHAGRKQNHRKLSSPWMIRSSASTSTSRSTITRRPFALTTSMRPQVASAPFSGCAGTIFAAAETTLTKPSLAKSLAPGKQQLLREPVTTSRRGNQLRKLQLLFT
jgi:hypothetical protein